jgi:hypothetical protein
VRVQENCNYVERVINPNFPNWEISTAVCANREIFRSRPPVKLSVNNIRVRVSSSSLRVHRSRFEFTYSKRITICSATKLAILSRSSQLSVSFLSV